MNEQYITSPEGTQMVVVPASDYKKIVEMGQSTFQDALDVVKTDMAWAEYQANPEQQVPTELFYKVLDGENPVRVYREWRGLSIQELADKIGISHGYLSHIERGHREGKVAIYVKISECLNVALEYIVPVEQIQEN